MADSKQSVLARLLSSIRPATDVLNRGMVAGAIGAPVDIASMAMRPFGYKTAEPVGGSDWIMRQMENAGAVSPERRPLSEFAASMASPGGALKAGLAGLALVGSTKGQKLAGIIKKTSAEKAHDMAQKNASLPVSKGGLGLPKDNTAMDRADALGFSTDMPLYHGTNKDFNEFKLFEGDDPSRAVSRSPVGKLGVSLAVDPDLANVFASRAGNPNSNVLPVFHRADSRASVNLEGGESNADVFGTVLDAWKQGKDGLMFNNYSIPEINNQRFIMVKNPNQIRSIHAAFDPKKRNSANILAGTGAGAVGLGLFGLDEPSY